MQVAVQLEFKAERKEPLGAVVRRVAALFASSGLEPAIDASFSDGPAGLRSTSAVERAIKKHPHLAALERNDSPQLQAGLPPIRRLTNTGATAPFELADVIALADGVPRSLPFHAVHVGFGHADFGTVVFPFGLAPRAGIAVGDGWWVNGRMRSLTAFYSVEGTPASKKLPDPPAAVAAILTGLGKPRKTAQFVAPETVASPEQGAPIPRDASLVMPILVKYRKDMAALVARVGLPFDLPPAADARASSRGARGPLQPTLVAAFRPRGSDCPARRHLHAPPPRRRTTSWTSSSGPRHVEPFGVHVPACAARLNATLSPPVTARGESRQYPIGDAANWQIVAAHVRRYRTN